MRAYLAGIRKTALDALRQVLAARGEMSDVAKQRLAGIKKTP